ncbi:enoyl-CoA hydratase-related protein [Pseudonocardia halophobica]|uniref:3-hydroxybutyryl-CoA dehydratase n=1 Tax=Pseudonocardia halophobica TaxID=29401 RepID=A0A9W6L3K3_9PSEU|nr:enoyl-CoA hydratase-related protein [Pseudonocardia halophobica]GLL12255.1 3-hydroxybutyryl-CoA dehydratase [Pseudonocardia halophobica]
MSTDPGTVTVSTHDDGLVATVLLDRASRRNALAPELLLELEAALEEIAASASRVVLVRTAGTRAFSVGADITAFTALAPVDMWRRWTAVGHRVFARLAALPQPTIAVVDGPALGGGLELALACDFRIAHAAAELGLPETGLGLIPGWGGTERLTRLVGPSRAKEIILTRRPVDARTALAWGLVTRSPVDDLDAEVDRFVADLLGSGPLAQQVAKQLVDAAVGGAPSSVLEAVACGFVATTEDFAEGVGAFLDKRTPGFLAR